MSDAPGVLSVRDARIADAPVVEFWRRLGLPGLFDVHVHFMPERLLQRVWAYFDSAGPLVGRPWPISYRWSQEERLAHLRALGVRRFSALVYPHKPEMAAWLNDWGASFAAATPDALHTATFFPEPSAAVYVPAAIEAGARLFKAHVQVGGYDPRDPLLRPVWGAIAEAGLPVVLHAGSGPAPGRFTGPGPVAEVLAAFPRLRLVIAHLGMPEYDAFLDLAESYDEVRLDTTMAFVDFFGAEGVDVAALRPRLRELGDRVLFGTDFPNIPYPYAHQVGVLAGLDLGDDWLRAVCWSNGAALFGLDG